MDEGEVQEIKEMEIATTDRQDVFRNVYKKIMW